MTSTSRSSLPRSPSEALDVVRQTIAELFELELGEVQPQSTVFEDLDLDSIDAIDLVAKLQQLTGERIEEQAMRQVRTVQDLADLVAAQFDRRNAGTPAG